MRKAKHALPLLILLAVGIGGFAVVNRTVRAFSDDEEVLSGFYCMLKSGGEGYRPDKKSGCESPEAYYCGTPGFDGECHGPAQMDKACAMKNEILCGLAYDCRTDEPIEISVSCLMTVIPCVNYTYLPHDPNPPIDPNPPDPTPVDPVPPIIID